MKRAYLFLIIFVFAMGSISAQSFVGKLNQNPSMDFRKITSSDTLKILAVMSDFQVDIDDATFGDGKFGSIYSEDYGSSILDPLPHDKAYFENHLKFVQNYFAKVSDGNLNVSYTVLDEILTVSKTMRNYTPPLEDLNDHTPLVEYLDEVWQLADENYPNFNFSDYDLFFVLHAGVGKDVSLPGSLGNERDLPSVYLNEKSLQNILGSDFEGFPVNGGNYKIKNSAILPETESREVEGFDGITLIELTTNGLFAATIGSYLGLPDLYNTETGRSAIGRFGLMDGQSIFTYQGIFPPEPSAWEKMFLGWVTPTEVAIGGVGDQNINLVNRYAANLGDTTLLKIPINATEYYLIENRKRDAFQDGSNITYISNGQTYTKTFDKDFLSYIYYSVDTLEGVIIDVDEFDWALPGGDRNSTIEKFEDLGILIWHIDEKIIAENYESNTINNDRYTRGVALVEADGIRDIGEEFQTIFGETVIGEGTKEDTWYKNNPAEYYENKFSADTKPKAESNSKANSLITLSDFSEISNKVSFNLSFGSEYIDLIGNISLDDVSPHFYWLSSTNIFDDTYLFLSNTSKTYLMDSSGKIENEISCSNKFKPAVIANSISVYVASSSFDELVVTKFIPSIDSIIVIESYPHRFSTSPIITEVNENNYEILIGTDDGRINRYSIDLSDNSFQLIDSTKVLNSKILKMSNSLDAYAAVSKDEFWSSNNPSYVLELKEVPKQLVLTETGEGELVSIIGFKNGFTKISGNKQLYYGYGYQTSIMIRSERDRPVILKENDLDRLIVHDDFALCDLKMNGENYIVKNTGNYLNTINQTGSTASNFPFQDEFESTFYSSPLAVDLNNDDAADIISFTEDGKILAVDGISGKMIDGFPISSGGKVATTPIIFTENGRTALGVVTEENQFMSWNISQYDGKKFWTEENGNAGNTSSALAASSSEKVNEFFPQSKTYNWPNPVYDGITNIRYFVSEDSKAEVTIFDLAGDLVAELSGNGVGGFDNEIVWNVNDIQSGVYFAHVKVTSNSGKTDTKIIKIAVIK
jgi:M6 family metalloprotease-like protein